MAMPYHGIPFPMVDGKYRVEWLMSDRERAQQIEMQKFWDWVSPPKPERDPLKAIG